MPNVDLAVWNSRIGDSALGGYITPTLASAATISPTTPVTKLTGVGPVSAIIPPWPGFVGHITFLLAGGVAFATGGASPNGITSAVTGVANEAVTMFYDGQAWWPMIAD